MAKKKTTAKTTATVSQIVPTSKGPVEALPPRTAVSLLDPTLFMQNPDAWHDEDTPLLVSRKIIMEFYQDGFQQGQEEAFPRGYEEGHTEGKKAGILEGLIKAVKSRGVEVVKKVMSVDVAMQTDPVPTRQLFNSSVQTVAPSAISISAPSSPSPPITSPAPLPDPPISWSDDTDSTPLPPPMYTPRDFSHLRSDDVKDPFSSLRRRCWGRKPSHRQASKPAQHLKGSHPSSAHSAHIPVDHQARGPDIFSQALRSFIHSVVLEATRTPPFFDWGTWSRGSYSRAPHRSYR